MATKKLRSVGLALLQRLAFSVLILGVIVYLTLFGLDMARGVPFQDALGQALEKTLAYAGNLARGDLGMSLAGGLTQRPVPVAEVVPERLIRSLGLLAVSLLLASVSGVLLGIMTAWKRKTNWPFYTIVLSIIGVSIPSFFAALLLQLGVIRLTQIAGRTLLPAGGFGWDWHLLLPALVLAARPFAQIARVTYISLSENLDQDYVRTAYSKGLNDRRVVNRHVLRNVAVPVLTTIGLSLRFALSSLPVVEFFFGWPGLGFTLLRGISMGEDNLTVALVLCLGGLFILVNMLLELAYRIIDPRLSRIVQSVAHEERLSLASWARGLWTGLRDLALDNPLRRWLDSRRLPVKKSPFQEVLEERGEEVEVINLPDARAGERRAWLRGTLGNFMFMAGLVLVAGLAAVLLFGPELAPHSPYTTQGLKIIDGEIQVPPFPPSDVHPWGTDVLGRDMMSLILAGAQQTLILAGLVVLARLVVGFTLGAVAGWFNGSWADRVLLATTEILNAFPTLLLAMILVLGLGIRRGFQPFVIALCFIGWGEIMQFVRGQVMTIKPKLFIESALALGQRTSRIIVKHVLPNLAPGLISLTSLEMGAVLMLLGELGFIGIFIGGGAFAELDVYSPPYHYSDVPEWGALLSNVRVYARSYPWTALYPALAFFVAILGFNLFGEGVRRMVEIVGVGITRLVNRYTLSAAVVAVAGFVSLRGSTGSLAYYQRQAEAFDGEHAMAHVQALTTPEMQGRALGSQGLDRAADYIAGQFEELGIQPAGEKMTYFQSRERTYEALTAVPELSIADGGPPLEYREDFAEYPLNALNMGEMKAPISFVSLGNLTRAGNWFNSFKALDKLDYSDRILLLISESDLEMLSSVRRGGVLMVTEDPAMIKRRFTLSSSVPRYGVSFGMSETSGAVPLLWITVETANRLLEPTGLTVADLRVQSEQLGQDEVLEVPTQTTVRMSVQGEVKEDVTARHVIGHMPGVSDSRYEGINDEMVVVMAQYDNPPVGPNETVFPGANDNASGVAAMLELIRTMRESGYQPYRTFLFVAYSGEGFEGGEPVSREISKFLQTKYGFSSSFDIVSIIELRGLGAGGGDRLLLSAGGSMRLANLFESAADRLGVPVRRAGEKVDLSVVFEERSVQQGGQEAPFIELNWDGWQTTMRTALDRPERIEAGHLQDGGRVLGLSMMILGRERDY